MLTAQQGAIMALAPVAVLSMCLIFGGIALFLVRLKRLGR